MWGHKFCSADGESHGLCSLFKCHYEQSYWMGYKISCVLTIAPGPSHWKSLFRKTWELSKVVHPQES